MFTNAIVRPPCARFAEGLTTIDAGAPNYARALRQHAAYCEAFLTVPPQPGRPAGDPGVRLVSLARSLRDRVRLVALEKSTVSQKCSPNFVRNYIQFRHPARSTAEMSVKWRPISLSAFPSALTRRVPSN